MEGRNDKKKKVASVCFAFTHQEKDEAAITKTVASMLANTRKYTDKTIYNCDASFQTEETQIGYRPKAQSKKKKKSKQTNKRSRRKTIRSLKKKKKRNVS